jgi:hypothetical protein
LDGKASLRHREPAMPRCPIGKLDTSIDQGPIVDRSVITPNVPQLCAPGSTSWFRMTSSRLSFDQEF